MGGNGKRRYAVRVRFTRKDYSGEAYSYDTNDDIIIGRVPAGAGFIYAYVIKHSEGTATFNFYDWECYIC